MKIETLKQRLKKDRPMESVTLRIPEDVVEELKTIAPLLGFSGYQSLIKAYIGQGLRHHNYETRKPDNYPLSIINSQLFFPCPK
ncbi:hypothetical protein IQ215_00745 [Cyanobacterium stanieri LEGE 03274]|uniref:CopG family transcriptional regulator n=1 Tax=Cyanobacterium stanieri LEGE 03274 TaxID=1828756 RepID=A0ABR9V0W3_9CHRO|nr:hypothetical protein [Cyanobacterium stanieri]MBE9221214.1 hypothetical protein [Cyanobacterium stanieri LEGE 03274]